MRRHRFQLVVLLLLAAAGCRAGAPAAPATPAAPALPTSATAGGTSIVAIAPPGQQCCPKQTLPQFLGITGACDCLKGLLNRLRNRLGAIWPGLEAKPEILALADPKNLDSSNPAIASAAAVKGEEDEAAHWFQTVLWIDPLHRPTLQALADYWQKKGNTIRATHFLYLAERKTPPDIDGTDSP